MANIRRSSHQSSGGKMYVVKLVYLAYNIRLYEFNCKFSLCMSVCLSVCLSLSLSVSLSVFQNMLYTFYLDKTTYICYYQLRLLRVVSRSLTHQFTVVLVYASIDNKHPCV